MISRFALRRATIRAMDFDELPDEDDPISIPEVLHSAYLEAPFRECVSCGTDLSDPDCIYQIQKTWKGGEVVLELAICGACAANLLRDFSEESLERMQRFFGERFRGEEAEDACNFCGAEIGEDTEYEIGAACRGSNMLRPPIRVCGECVASSQENLSRKTREAWGEFLDLNLPGVPQSMEPDTVPFTF
jgi:hypothetical protein